MLTDPPEGQVYVGCGTEDDIVVVCIPGIVDDPTGTTTVMLCVGDVPPGPVQLPEKTVLVLSAPVDADPDVPVCHGDPFVVMEHDVASVEDQAILDAAP